MAFENTPTSRHSASSRGELHTSRLPGCPDRGDRERADREADAEAGHASVESGDVGPDHDVRRPHQRREEDEEQPEGVAVDLGAPEHEDADDRKGQGDGVATAAGGDARRR